MQGARVIWRAVLVLGSIVCAGLVAPGWQASADDYAYVQTQSGNTLCSIGKHEVVCVGQPVGWLPVGPGNNAAQVNEAGHLTFTSVGMVGDPAKTVILRYDQTYHLEGWTVLPTNQGTRFTNNQSGKGMFVSTTTCTRFDVVSAGRIRFGFF